jgi:hypothetical protein
MKKYMLLLLVSLSPGGFAQNDFVRGIFLEDNVSVDFHQLHDSLHINWVQAYVDSYSGTKFTSVLQNSDSLKIMGLSRQTGSGFKSIVDKSSAQRMVFEAEQRNNTLTADEQALLTKARNGDTLAQEEFSGRMIAKTPPNMRRFIIDVKKYPILTPEEAEKKLQQLSARKTP